MVNETESECTLTIGEVKADAEAVGAMVKKYSDQATVLPGVLGSALGGLRTALDGLTGYVANITAILGDDPDGNGLQNRPKDADPAAAVHTSPPNL